LRNIFKFQLFFGAGLYAPTNNYLRLGQIVAYALFKGLRTAKHKMAAGRAHIAIAAGFAIHREKDQKKTRKKNQRVNE
jgi:hypothetical protein